MFIISKEKSIRIVSSHGRNGSLKLLSEDLCGNNLTQNPFGTVLLNYFECRRGLHALLRLLEAFKDLHFTAVYGIWYFPLALMVQTLIQRLLLASLWQHQPVHFLLQSQHNMRETFHDETRLHCKFSLFSVKTVLLISAEDCLIWYEHPDQLLHRL